MWWSAAQLSLCCFTMKETWHVMRVSVSLSLLKHDHTSFRPLITFCSLSPPDGVLHHNLLPVHLCLLHRVSHPSLQLLLPGLPPPDRCLQPPVQRHVSDSKNAFILFWKDSERDMFRKDRCKPREDMSTRFFLECSSSYTRKTFVLFQKTSNYLILIPVL